MRATNGKDVLVEINLSDIADARIAIRSCAEALRFLDSGQPVADELARADRILMDAMRRGARGGVPHAEPPTREVGAPW